MLVAPAVVAFCSTETCPAVTMIRTDCPDYARQYLRGMGWGFDDVTGNAYCPCCVLDLAVAGLDTIRPVDGPRPPSN